MAYFLRSGNTYKVTDEANVDIHKRLPVGNYFIKEDMFKNLFLEQIDGFDAPKKIYGDTVKTADRILNTFMDRTASTGVMLAGEKGSGKTLLSKMLSIKAAEQGIPTIVINSAWHGDAFNKLIQSIEQPCMVLWDEFEKVYDREEQEAILTLLDGVFPSKKLFVLTCNDKWRIDQHMRNRPGRIYYMMDFKGLEPAFIEEYCEDNLKATRHIETICKIASLFGEFNFDMLKALVEEMNRYGETPQEVMRMINAKPEFSDKSEYEVQMVINNKLISKDLLGSNGLWSGNPLNGGIEINYRLYDEDGSDWEWDEHNFSSANLKNVDSREGKFIFDNGKANLTLTRKKVVTVDYLAAF